MSIDLNTLSDKELAELDMTPLVQQEYLRRESETLELIQQYNGEWADELAIHEANGIPFDRVDSEA